jgi:hypothetical protein
MQNDLRPLPKSRRDLASSVGIVSIVSIPSRVALGALDAQQTVT